MHLFENILQNAELFAMTYGVLVVQLMQDDESDRRLSPVQRHRTLYRL
jgi:hypothetical protein